jgi:hypothetical protein
VQHGANGLNGARGRKRSTTKPITLSARSGSVHRSKRSIPQVHNASSHSIP